MLLVQKFLEEMAALAAEQIDQHAPRVDATENETIVEALDEELRRLWTVRATRAEVLRPLANKINGWPPDGSQEELETLKAEFRTLKTQYDLLGKLLWGEVLAANANLYEMRNSLAIRSGWKIVILPPAQEERLAFVATSGVSMGCPFEG